MLTARTQQNVKAYPYYSYAAQRVVTAIALYTTRAENRRYLHQILIENLIENSFTDTFSRNFEFAIKPS